MDPQPPTSSLPGLRNIDTHTLSTITAALINLRALYGPTSLVHATGRSAKSQAAHDSGYASAVEEEEEEGDEDEDRERKGKRAREEEEHEERLALLRGDALERAFAVRWLIGFIARSEGWVGAGWECDAGDVEAEAEAGGDDGFRVDKEREDRAHVVEEAAALLALSADTQADGTLSREFSFVVEGGERVVVELRDRSYEGYHESVGLQTWGSACVLAERVCAEPGKYLGFGLGLGLGLGCGGGGRRTARVLELGAGTGLLSMVVAKLQGVLGVQLDVVATDYHPAVLENLQENVAHNFGYGVDAVRVEMLDWADTPVIEEADKFDVILAADVIYDQRHGAWIKSCAEKMLGRAGKGEVMWLMVPMRPTRMGEVESLDSVFCGDEESELRIVEVENVPRCHRVGRADEVGYRLFRIGWQE